MPLNGLRKGATGEMLSLPLQQTARFLRDHYDDMTEEEAQVLQAGFECGLSEIGGLYNPVIADPVKGPFIDYPDREYLWAYFKVWLRQFLRHPDTYVQAFLNHVYGYFYIDYHNYGENLIFSYIGNTDHMQDGHFDMRFLIKSEYLREILRHYVYVAEKTPVLSLFLSCGFYTYVLTGTAVYLLAKKKRRELILLVPEFCVLLICMFSPVNGFLRYAMPIMASMPLQVSWGYFIGQKAEQGNIGGEE